MEEYFYPVESTILSPEQPYAYDDLFNGIKKYDGKGKFPVINKNTIVIIGIGEDRGAFNNKGCTGIKLPKSAISLE